MCGTQGAESFEAGTAAIGIEVHKDVVEYDGQWVDVIRIFANKSQPHRKIKLLSSTAAQQLRRKPNAIGAFDLDLSTIERGNDAYVPAFGHDGEKARCLAENLRLPLCFVDLPGLVEKSAT